MAIDDRGLSLPAVLGWIVSPTTWLALIHLFAGVVIGLVVSVATVLGISLGVSMLAVFGFGILILGATLWFSGLIARLERARYALLLGERIVAPELPAIAEGGLRGLWRSATRAQVWKNLAYALLRLPVSMI